MFLTPTVKNSNLSLFASHLKMLCYVMAKERQLLHTMQWSCVLCNTSGSSVLMSSRWSLSSILLNSRLTRPNFGSKSVGLWNLLNLTITSAKCFWKLKYYISYSHIFNGNNLQILSRNSILYKDGKFLTKTVILHLDLHSIHMLNL